MEFKDLKKIIDLVKEKGIVEFDLQDGEFRLSTKLQSSGSVQMISAPAAPAAPPSPAPAPVPAMAGPEVGAETAGPSIQSPMVGTFYRAASPDADPFVAVGDVVTPETTVCIIEAMKVMNEIKAETKGKIKSIAVENGEAVEFGQALFVIEPL
jgi:acetyl-CoA carboxylase biotin carboxyl carrier protein